jgi:putative peptidoglycan lipid II flippase
MPDAAPLARSAGLFGLATMASRLLGLIRDQVLAYYFGADDAMDAFRVAFRVPNLARDLFAEGAMSAAFVPTFTRELTTGGKPRAWQLAHSVITALVAITAVLVVVAMVFAEPLVRFYAAGFAEVPGKLERTIFLARLMAPFLTLVAVAAAFMGMLNALGHFFIPALSPAMFNIATIVLAVAFIPMAPSLGIEPIVFVAIATLVGGLGQILIQWRPLRREGYRFEPRLDRHDPALARVLLLMGPGTIGMAATQINILVNTQFASDQPGAVSWLDYAFRVMYLPIGLFGVSIAAASTPALARLAAEGQTARMKTTVGSAVSLMLALNVPATLGLMVLAEPIVGLIFERGNFTVADTAATARALRFYAVGLVGYSVVRILSPAFYALNKSRIPVAASVASVVANIVLNVMLVREMGYAGLALGTSLAAALNAALQFGLLRQHLGGLDGRRIATSLAKVVAASLVMAGAAWATDLWLDRSIPGDALVLRAARVGTTIAVALGVLAAAAWTLRLHELDEARSLIVRRLGRLR